MKMKSPQHLCVLYVATAGLQGNALGSDEQEVVLLVYVIVEVSANKVIGVQQYVVKPTVADINENVLSEQLVSESSLTEELVKSSGVPLQTAIQKFDSYVRSIKVEPNSPAFRFVTDGQLPLRQCLHPEACNKEIELPDCYNTFHDLRKDFRKFYNVPETEELSSISDLINYLGMNSVTDSEFYVKEAKDMVNLVQRLIADGHCFSNPEIVEIKLEPGICSKDEEIDNNCVVKARGLPWQSSDQDIAKFFRGLNMAKGGVALCLSAQGRRNGEALVRFVNQEHRDMALKRHKHHIANRYIEVYKAPGEDFINVAGGRTTEAETFLTQGAEVIIRMRGLPYDCTASQIISFFEAGPEDKACHVMNGEEGVLFVKKPDKKATGDAFVLFAEESDAPKALSKHRQLIGVRYIELFRSTPAEVQQVLNRSLDTKSFESKLVMPQIQPPVPLVPQFVITSGVRKDCIRLRGLPYEASVENILEFLGDFSKNIVYQGVHMVYNSQGQPSGEAFIQMDSEASAFQAAQGRHHRYMIYGKKQRYIEVFQCSSDDMNLVHSGGLQSTNASSPVTKALISPGMLSSSGSSPTPTPVHPTVFTQPPPTLQSPWDPLVNGHLLNSLQVQSAVQQNMIRQSQPDLWMMNPTLQHLAASQMNLALAKQNWVDLSGTAATPGLLPPVQSLPALPSPNVASSAPTTNIASSSIATSPSTSVVSSSAMMPTPQAAAYLPPHFPQAQPLYLYVPPRLPAAHFQPELPPPTVQSPNQQSLQSLQSAYALTPNHLVPPASQVPQLMGVKRSWDQAFPTTQNPLSPNGNAMKRQFSYPAVSNATALYSVPPPGQSISGFQHTQFFHATI